MLLPVVAVRFRVPPSHHRSTIVLYDDDCAFCHRIVRFARQRDRWQRLTFRPLQAEESQALLIKLGQCPTDLDSLRVVENSRVEVFSDGVLRICRHLPAPWCWLTLFSFVPRRLRDWLYRFVARHRQRFPGRARSETSR